MSFNTIRIHTSEHGNIPLTTTNIVDNPNTRVVQATPPFGLINWIVSDYKKFTFWHATLRIKTPVTLTVSSDNNYLGFLFAIKNDLQYTLQGLDPFTLLEYQSEMCYTPDFHLELQLAGSTHIICGLTFKTNYFKTWHQMFSPLEHLLGAVKNHQPSRIRQNPIGITPRISATLHNILHCQYDGPLRIKYINVKVTELTLQILQNISSSNEANKINTSDLATMQKVRSYLLDNLREPGTIQQIAHKFGLNDFKLKQTFRQVFGTSIYAFLLETRMHQALQSILETDLPIAHIAHLSGYENPSSFSTAFKNKFGYTPSTLRKGTH